MSLEDSAETFSIAENKKSILFEGTNVVTTIPYSDNNEVYGLVLRTGFTTLKGITQRFHLF